MAKRKNAGRERLEAAFNASLRTVAVVDLASLVGSDALESSLDGAAENLHDELLDTDYSVHESLRPLRALAEQADEDGAGLEFFGELLTRTGTLGLAVQFSTPVMERLTARSLQFSWGYTQSTWVYAETYEAAWALGLAWAEKCKDNAKRAPKRRSATATASA